MLFWPRGRWRSRRRGGPDAAASSGLEVIALLGALAVLGVALGGRRTRPDPARAPAGPPEWVRAHPVSPEEAERRSPEPLRSVVNPDEWEMFRDLGSICVTGRHGVSRAGAPLRTGREAPERRRPARAAGPPR